MDFFYIIVPTVAIIILIIILAYLGIQMKTVNAGSISYPPNYSSCPDYWTVTGNNCQAPSGTNAVNLGNFTTSNPMSSSNTPGFINPTTVKFFGTDSGATWTTGSNTGLSAQCSMKKWANMYGIMWDGISNYNGCGL